MASKKTSKNSLIKSIRGINKQHKKVPIDLSTFENNHFQVLNKFKSFNLESNNIDKIKKKQNFIIKLSTFLLNINLCYLKSYYN